MSLQTLREARDAAKLTQDELAAKSGVAQATISSLERGTRTNPTIDTVDRLAKALGIAPSKIKFPSPRTAAIGTHPYDRAGHTHGATR